jgi:hypothetical protein
MTQELHYTSLPRGLKPGSRGFCTVASTPGMTGQLADRLESLSGYVPVYPVHDSAAAKNPISFMHLRLPLAGKLASVLSRVGPAGLDYSGRTNKYAHHVVLEANERPAGGPAWLISQPDFLKIEWTGEPRLLEEGTTPPQGDRPAGVARAWEALTGDAGWAGVLAESFLADPRRPAVLVFRPGMELLPLLVEAIALLPPSRRWDAEFCSYFTTLPSGVNCPWRGVLEGSTEAEHALRLPSALIINLCRPMGEAQGRELVDQARTGKRTGSPSSADEPSGIQVPGRTPSGAAGGTAPRAPAIGPPGAPSGRVGGYPVVPPIGAAGAETGLASNRRGPLSRVKKRTLAIGAMAVALCLAGIAAVAFLLSPRPERRTVVSEPDRRTRDTSTTTGRVLPASPPEAPQGAIAQTTKSASGQPANTARGDPPQRNGEARRARDESSDTTIKNQPTQVARATKTTHGPAQASPKLDELLSFVLKDPPTAGGPPDSVQSFDLRPSTGSASAISIQGLKICDASRNKMASKMHSKASEADQGGLDVMIRVSGELENEDKPLAHFGVSPGKVSFHWAEFAKHDELSRNLLRDCCLVIGADGQSRYLLLRERPAHRSDPLRIREMVRPKSQDSPYFPLSKSGPAKPSVEVPWQQPGKIMYDYLKDMLVITKIRARSPAGDRDIRFHEGDEPDEWVVEGIPRAIMKTRLDRVANRVQFTFSQNPYQIELKRHADKQKQDEIGAPVGGDNPASPGPAQDASADRDFKFIKELLDAEYSLVLGLRFDDHVVEFVRIGTFAEDSGS